MDLLLLADPSEALVRSYAHQGITVGATRLGNPIGVYVLLQHSQDLMELKNIAVHTDWQGKGLGKILLYNAIERAGDLGAMKIEVGTGNSSFDQIRFYEKAGFVKHRVDEGFFLRNYDDPIYENGIQCTDMIVFAREI